MTDKTCSEDANSTTRSAKSKYWSRSFRQRHFWFWSTLVYVSTKTSQILVVLNWYSAQLCFLHQ